MNTSNDQNEKSRIEYWLQGAIKAHETFVKGLQDDLQVEQNKNKKLAKEKEIIYSKGKGYQEKYDALLVQNTNLTEEIKLLKNGQNVPCVHCETYKSQLKEQKDMFEKTYDIVLREKDRTIARLERHIKSLQRQAKHRSKKHFQSADTECDTLIPDSCDEMDTLKVNNEEEYNLQVDRTKNISGSSKDSGIEREVPSFEKHETSICESKTSETSPGRSSKNLLKLQRQGKRSRYRYTEEPTIESKRQKVKLNDSSNDEDILDKVKPLISKEETQAVTLASPLPHKTLVPETCVGYTMDTSVLDSMNIAVKEKQRTDRVKKSSKLNRLERPDIVIPETVPFDGDISDEDSNDSMNSSHSVLPQSMGKISQECTGSLDCDVVVIRHKNGFIKKDESNTTGNFFVHSKSSEEQISIENDIASKEAHGTSPVFGTPNEKKKLNPDIVVSRHMSPSNLSNGSGGKYNSSMLVGKPPKPSPKLPQESFKKKCHLDLDSSTASNPSLSVLSGRSHSQANILPVEQPNFDDGEKKFSQEMKQKTISSQPDQISLALAYSTRSQSRNSGLSGQDYTLKRTVSEPCSGKKQSTYQSGKLVIETNTGPKKKYIQSKITSKTFQNKSVPVHELKEFNGGRLCSPSQEKLSEKEKDDIEKAIRLSMGKENSQGRVLRSQRNASQSKQSTRDTNLEMEDIERAMEMSVREMENIENTMNQLSGEPRMTSTLLPPSPAKFQQQNKNNDQENMLFKKPNGNFPISPRNSPRLQSKIRGSQDNGTSKMLKRHSSRSIEDSFQTVPHNLMPTENGSIDPNIRLSQYEDDSAPNDNGLYSHRTRRRKKIDGRIDQTKNELRHGVRAQEIDTQSVESDLIESSGKSVVFGKRQTQQAPSMDETEHLNDSVGDIFDMQAYEDEDAEESVQQETLVSIEELHSMPDNSFDVVPSKSNEPNYAYVGAPVRKQEERRKMNAYACRECLNYFKGMDLTEEELQKRMKNCKHKAKFQAPGTPEHFWSIGFPDTQVCEERGYMNTTQAKPSTHRRRKNYKQLFNGKEKADVA